MMTFKQFYLQSSKGDKAPPRALRSSQNSAAAERDFGSDREAQGSKGSFWAIGHELIDMSLMKARSVACLDANEHVRSYPLTMCPKAH